MAEEAYDGLESQTYGFSRQLQTESTVDKYGIPRMLYHCSVPIKGILLQTQSTRPWPSESEDVAV